MRRRIPESHRDLAPGLRGSARRLRRHDPTPLVPSPQRPRLARILVVPRGRQEAVPRAAPQCLRVQEPLQNRKPRSALRPARVPHAREPRALEKTRSQAFEVAPTRRGAPVHRWSQLRRRGSPGCRRPAEARKENSRPESSLGDGRAKTSAAVVGGGAPTGGGTGEGREPGFGTRIQEFTRMRLGLEIPFQLASAAAETRYRAAIFDRVSPRFTS